MCPTTLVCVAYDPYENGGKLPSFCLYLTINSTKKCNSTLQPWRSKFSFRSFSTVHNCRMTPINWARTWVEPHWAWNGLRQHDDKNFDDNSASTSWWFYWLLQLWSLEHSSKNVISLFLVFLRSPKKRRRWSHMSTFFVEDKTWHH